MKRGKNVVTYLQEDVRKDFKAACKYFGTNQAAHLEKQAILLIKKHKRDLDRQVKTSRLASEQKIKFIQGVRKWAILDNKC